MDAACRAAFGRRVRESRDRLGFTRDALGQLAGRDGDWIYNIERGRHTPDPQDLYNLADALQVQTRWLATGVSGLPGTEQSEERFDAWIAGLAGITIRLPLESQRLIEALVTQVALQSQARTTLHHLTQAIDQMPDHPESLKVRRQLQRAQRELVALALPESPAPRGWDIAPPTGS